MEISQNSQEKTVPETLFKKSLLLKKSLWHRFFSCEFCKISKSTFFYRTPPVAVFAFRHLSWPGSFAVSRNVSYFCLRKTEQPLLQGKKSGNLKNIVKLCETNFRFYRKTIKIIRLKFLFTILLKAKN